MKMMKKNVWKLSMMMAALAGITLFSSCLNSDDDYTPEPQAGLFLLHAAPGIGGTDVYLNTTKLFDPVFKFTYHTSRGVKPADYRIAFVSPVSGSTDTLAAVSDSLKDRQTYSAILYDTASAVKVMLIEDRFESAQSNGSAFLRFLQLSPGDLSVTVNIDKDQFTANRHFADNVVQPDLAKFQPLSYGTYSFTALDANGDTLGQAESKELVANGYYTLYLTGYEGATEDSLKIKLRLARSY